MPARRSLAAGLAVALGLGVTLSASSSAAPPELPVHQRPITWTNQFGTAGDEIGDTGPRIGRASNGDLYVATSSSGAFPGLVNVGNDDVVLRKFDKNGNVKWTRQFGSAGADYVTGLAVTSGGDTYLAGTTTGDMDGVGPGPLGGVHDAFLAKYDKNGNQKWIRQFGSTAYDGALAVTLAGSSDVYVAGGTDGDLDGFDQVGGGDGFLARYDKNGNQKWIRQFGTPFFDWAFAITVRGSEIYVGGSSSGDIDLIPPDNSDPSGDAFLMRWHREGYIVWSRAFGAPGVFDRVASIAVTGTKDVWVSGDTGGDVDGGGPGPFGSTDPFAARWDRDGNSVWFSQWGSGAYDDARVIAATTSGAVFVTGYTDSDIDAAGPGTQQGGGDMYLATLSRTTGGVTTMRQFGSSEFEGYPHFVLTSSSLGKPVVAGTTSGAVTGHANAGGYDVFLTQFG